jgi:very-short-patch-repair endonuclease
MVSPFLRRESYKMDSSLKTTPRIRGSTRALDAAARGFRRDPTPAEGALWRALRGRQLGGLQFRRQHPMGAYILDFCCPSCRLVVEVDGDIHVQQADDDQARTEQLNAYGYHVIRFRNEEVLTDLPAVLDAILRAAVSRAR